MTLRNRRGAKPLPLFLTFALLMPISVCAQYRQSSENTQSPRRGQEEEVYHESKLRRFEIITLTSLPFAAIHSYLVIRGVETIRQNEFAPELSVTNYRIIGVSAASFALFIGFWDWLRTHGEDPAQQLIPASPAQRTREAGAANWDIEDRPYFVLPFVHVLF